MRQPRRLSAAFVLLGVPALVGAGLWYFLGPPSTEPELARLPHVVKAEVLVRGSVPRPAGLIVHVHDYHLAPGQPDPERHLADVEAVQSEQVELLRALYRRDARAFWLEGLTMNGMQAWRARVAGLAELQRELQGLKAGPAVRGLAELELAARREAAELGAPARIQAAGEVLPVAPLDEEGALDAADPARHGGEHDPDALRARHRAMAGGLARDLGQAGGMAVLLLGAGHDLSREVREFLPGWRYFRLTTARVRDLMGE